MTAANCKAKTAVALFFVLLTVIGICTVGDYNGSYDELVEQGILASNLKEYALRLRESGISWDYWLQSEATPISQSVERDHGICGYYLYGMLLPLFESSESLRFSLWSALTWMWFMLGCWSLYAIARKLGMNRILACAAVLLLYLSPRFFADGHLNNKDIVVFSMMLATLWLGACFAERPTVCRGILFSLMGAMAMNTKIVAAMAWGLMYAGAFVKVVLEKKIQRGSVAVFLSTAVGFLLAYLLLTPAAWDAPLELFSYLIQNAAAFSRWSGTLYFRDASFQLPDHPLPVYYLPYMILVTVPLYTLPLCAVGQLTALGEALRSPRAFFSDVKGLLLTASSVVWFLPVVAFAVLRPIVYNGWRHFYFVFTGLAVLAGYGIAVLWRQKHGWFRKGVAVGLSVCFAVTAIGMVINHPRQSSYYNALAGNLAMETDYWTTSGTYALEKLFESEERNQDLPLEVGCYFLDLQNARFKLSDEYKAVLTTTIERDSPYLYYNENYVQVYNVPDPEGYHVLFEVESYGRLIGTMYERDQ